MDIRSKDILKTLNCAYEKFNKKICDHSLQVAYLTMEICKNLNLGKNKKDSLILAAYLHDLSASRTNMTDSLDKYESSYINEHCLYGYIFFKFIFPNSDLCKYILYHHTPYNSNYVIDGIDIPTESNIIKIADDISIYNLFNEEVTTNNIIEMLKNNFNEYNPEYLSKFLDNNANEVIRNLLDGSYIEKIWGYFDNIDLKKHGNRRIIKCLAFIVDCKCDITNFHSLSVYNISCMLAKYLNIDKKEKEKEKIEMASLLHDIGKIAIPDEILKKESSLTKDEFNIMKQHIVYTYEILSYLNHEDILNIASNHHEKLNGKGYPRGISELSISERIVAVADIFSALIQKRSYKKQFPKEQVIDILNNCVRLNEIDDYVVNKIIENYDYLELTNNKLLNFYNKKVLSLKYHYEEISSKCNNIYSR
ncbi:HD domain-containing phosphohydrolase [Clostridioides difficile]